MFELPEAVFYAFIAYVRICPGKVNSDINLYSALLLQQSSDEMPAIRVNTHKKPSLKVSVDLYSTAALVLLMSLYFR